MKRTAAHVTQDNSKSRNDNGSNSNRKKTKKEDRSILQRLANASVEGPSAFPSLAEFLMNQCVIHVQDNVHHVNKLIRVTELEFYLKDLPENDRKHIDPFPHCMPIQLQPAQWYFHMISATKKYSFKGGSYKGTDLTFGNSKSYGGILFRAVSFTDNEGKEKRIEGPSLLTDQILAFTHSSSVLQLVEDKLGENLLAVDHGKNDRDVSLLIRTRNDVKNLDDESLTAQLNALFDDNNGESDKVIACPRFGLSLKKHTVDIEQKLRYIMREYRFCIRPREMKKGRHNVLVSLYGRFKREGLIDKDEIAKCMDQIMPFKGAQAKNFLDAAERGEDKRSEIMASEPDIFYQTLSVKLYAYVKKFFVGSFSLTTFAELYTFLEDLSPTKKDNHDNRSTV